MIIEDNQVSSSKKSDDQDFFEIKDKADTIGQMKNIAQEKDLRLKESKEIEMQLNSINSFDDLIGIFAL